MQSINIAVIDDNKEFCQLLYDYFSTKPEINVVAVGYNGRDAINILQQEDFRVLLLDMIMPELDGLAVLQWIKTNRPVNKPKVIIFSAFAQEEVARNALQLGVDYYILKPFDLNILTQRIIEIATGPSLDLIAQHKQVPKISENLTNELELEITKVIQGLRIPPNFKGYAYLRDAIMVTIKEPGLINEVTKKLYPLIAEHYNTTKHRVERSMRFAIETAWSKGDIQVLNELFGYCIDHKKGKPTNASFIAKIADKIRLEKKIRVG